MIFGPIIEGFFNIFQGPSDQKFLIFYESNKDFPSDLFQRVLMDIISSEHRRIAIGFNEKFLIIVRQNSWIS